METKNLFTFNFKKILYKLIIPYFLLICSGGLFFHYFFEKYIIFGSEISGEYKVNRILNSDNKNEIVIIGSSRARGGIVPEILGKNVFNYGIDGTGYNYITFMLEQELNKNKNTPIIFLFDFEWDKLGIGQTEYFIPNSSNEKVLKLFKNRFKFYHYIPFLKYFGSYTTSFKYYLNNKINYSKYTNQGGSFEILENTKKSFQLNVKLREESKIFFTGTDMHKLDSLIRSTNRKIIILSLPYHKSYLKSIQNYDKLNEFKLKFKNFSNVYYIDYSELPLDDSMYFNTSHLNYKGAKFVTKKLKAKLNSLNIEIK